MSTHNYLTLMSEEFPDRIGSEGREEIEAVINEEGFKPEEEWEEEFDHDELTVTNSSLMSMGNGWMKMKKNSKETL